MGRTTSGAGEPLIGKAGKRGGWAMLGRILCSFLDPGALGDATLMFGASALAMFLLYTYGDTAAPNPCESTGDAALLLTGQPGNVTLAGAGASMQQALTQLSLVVCEHGRPVSEGFLLRFNAFCEEAGIAAFVMLPDRATSATSVADAFAHTVVTGLEAGATECVWRFVGAISEVTAAVDSAPFDLTVG